jgi:polyisoprenoid-binding protein YceI
MDGNIAGFNDNPQPTFSVTPENLELDNADNNQYGFYYGSNENRDDKSFTFEGTNSDIALSVDGYDIDSNSEIEVLLNGNSIGFLTAGPDNALNGGDYFIIDASDQLIGSNTITFKQSFPGFIWGITNVLLDSTPDPQFSLLLDSTDNNQYGFYYGSNENRDDKSFTFEGTNSDIALSVDGYDIDSNSEIEVLLNGNSIGFLTAGPDNALNGGDYFIIDASDQLIGSNTITFKQSFPGFIWGITNVLISVD